MIPISFGTIKLGMESRYGSDDLSNLSRYLDALVDEI
jgi:hypothetical protein